MKNKSVVIRQNVGIDVSKDTFDVCLVQKHQDFENKIIGREKLPNTPEGFTTLMQWATQKAASDVDLSFTMEATGVYYEPLAYYLSEHKAKVHVLLPSAAHKYNQSMGHKSKTDKIDAYKLGCIGAERNLAIWNPISQQFRILRVLTREHHTLKEQIAVLKNQLHALTSAHEVVESTLKRYNEHIEYIQQQAQQIQQEIQTIVQEDAPLHERVKKVLTIPGVGMQTLICVLAETNGFENITSAKQLTSYAGYDVLIWDSGQKIGTTKISKKGNTHIRAAMFLPACSAAMHNKPLKEDYQRLKDNNKKPMVANTAIQRKLLCLIYTLWKNNTVFDPEYETKKQQHKQKQKTSEIV